jgi:hypothetical protein
LKIDTKLIHNKKNVQTLGAFFWKREKWKKTMTQKNNNNKIKTTKNFFDGNSIIERENDM